MRFPLAFLFLSTPLFAADLTVAPGGNIQTVIDQAVAGDRVLVAAGTYTQTIDFKGKAIEVLAVDGASVTTIDGAGASPVVRFATGEGTSSRLTGFTVTGGAAFFGAGGIECSGGATPTISDCTVRGNTGKRGAGVAGSPVMERCVITANTSSLNHGGGLYGAPTLKHCIVAKNTCTSADGGGLYVAGGTALVEDSLFIENRAVFADSHGGGVYVGSGGVLDMRRSIVTGNSASGGVFAGWGGGIAAPGTGSTLMNCTVLSNSVTGSSVSGAGVFGPVTVVNSIVRSNVGGQISGATVSYSNVMGGFAGVGNINVDPAFVAATGGDYHLGQGSSAIDAGAPTTFDPDGSIADMGAFPFATLYARANTDPIDWDAPTWANPSAVLGGSTRLRVLAGSAHAGEIYWILGSASGNTPGVDLLGVHLPLNFDTYMLLTLTQPGSPGLVGFLGTLDTDGRGDATLTIPSDPNGVLSGVTASHVALVGIPGAPAASLVTNLLDVNLQ
jgi:hypothetical protein